MREHHTTLVVVESDTYHSERTTVYDFTDEITMLEHFVDFVIKHDPDITQGQNIEGFDNPYIVKRFQILGKTPVLGRFPNTSTSISTYQGKENVKIRGRVVQLLHPQEGS